MSHKKITNKFLESILLEFSESFGITKSKEFKQFEHLSNYTIISKLHPEAFESLDQLTSVDVDTGSNYGIDGAAIIVNGNLLTNKEDIKIYSKSRKLEIKLVFIQAKTSTNYESGDVSKFGSAVQNFFSKTPPIEISNELKRVKGIYNELMTSTYLRRIDRKKFPKVELHYVTTSRNPPNSTIEAVSKQWENNIKLNDKDIANVDFQLHGSDYLIDTYDDLTNKYTVTINFERRLDLNTIGGVNGSYIGFLDYANFLELITDQNGIIRRNIFYENVRDFQGVENKVNSEINETLSSDELIDKFILFNNGITVVSKQLIPLQNNEYELGEFQVVNGCQTSNILYLNKNHLLNNKSIWIPIKLIHTTDNEVISSIVKATNRQTPVPDEAFIALERFHRNLQKYYELTSKKLHDKIYYERRSREFQNSELKIEKYRIANIHKQIRGFTAIMLNEPHTVASNHPYSIIRSKRETLFNVEHKYEPYFISSYILYFVNFDLAKGVIFDKQFLFVFYIGMMLRIIITRKIKIHHFNGKEVEQDFTQIMKVITDLNHRKELYKTVFRILNFSQKNHSKMHGKYTIKDLIRLRSFRDEVIKNLAKGKKD